MEVKGASVFKVIAFQKVGRILSDMAEDVRAAYDRDELKGVEGIGESSRRIIAEYLRTGRSTEYDEAAASVPAGLLGMLDIPGLGPKTVSMFWKEKGITSLEELVKAIDDGSLKGLKGIGDKKLQAIKEGIALRRKAPAGSASSRRCRSRSAWSSGCGGCRRCGRPSTPAASVGARRRSATSICSCSANRPYDARAIAEALPKSPR
jgi:hypothetical protein